MAVQLWNGNDLTWKAAIVDNLWDAPEAYISEMPHAIKDRSQWGGFDEATAITYYWNAQLVVWNTCSTHAQPLGCSWAGHGQ